MGPETGFLLWDGSVFPLTQYKKPGFLELHFLFINEPSLLYTTLKNVSQ
jgi:hypothetical protein